MPSAALPSAQSVAPFLVATSEAQRACHAWTARNTTYSKIVRASTTNSSSNNHRTVKCLSDQA
eukprot:9036214-Lingulodinium_polyedra.AAC.1